jgi:hypothetical protein
MYLCATELHILLQIQKVKPDWQDWPMNGSRRCHSPAVLLSGIQLVSPFSALYSACSVAWTLLTMHMHLCSPALLPYLLTLSLLDSHASQWQGRSTTICMKRQQQGLAQWLVPIILATQEMEIRRIVTQGQPRQKVSETPSQPIKAGQSGACLTSQLCGKHK